MPENVIESEYVVIETPAENKIEILTREALPEEFHKELIELIKKYVIQ